MTKVERSKKAIKELKNAYFEGRISQTEMREFYTQINEELEILQMIIKELSTPPILMIPQTFIFVKR